MTIPFAPQIAMALVCLVGGVYPSTLAQDRVDDPSLGTGCEREIKKLGPTPMGRKIRDPWRTRRVSPTYPPIPKRTTGGGVWIGEILIDTHGKVSGVWTIREVKLTPPVRSLNKSITDAVAKWEFAPAAVDDVPVPTCQTVTVNVNLEAIRAGR
jgi:outer membrane biosynthesis protein TonB